MATKKRRPTASRSRTAAGAKQGEMTEGDMNRPVKEGLMEMPTGGETHGGPGTRAGRPGPIPGMESGVMPGESPGTATGAPGVGMPGGDMEST